MNDCNAYLPNMYGALISSEIEIIGILYFHKYGVVILGVELRRKKHVLENLGGWSVIA